LQGGPLGEATAGERALAAGDFVVGLSLIACGVACRRRRRESRIGDLLAGAGFAWFLGTFVGSALGPAATFGALFVTLHRGPLIHAVLSYPTGRLSGRFERLVVASGYIWAAIPALGESPVLAIVVSCALTGAALVRQGRVSGTQHRARGVALAGALAFAVVVSAGGVTDLSGASASTDRVVSWAYQAVVFAIALGLVVDLFRGAWTRATVTGLVVELGKIPSERILRERLADALADPSLTVGYWLPDEGVYVDEDGRLLRQPTESSGREMTVIQDEAGDPVAVLVHDVGVLEDAELLSSVAAAARIAVSNVRLQREIRSQVHEVAASRRRIVESAEVQRRRLEEELRAGAERRLAHVEVVLAGARGDGAARTLLDQALAELERARVDLRELGRGILPELLTRGGLSAALADLARRGTVPVTIRVAPGRFPAAIEAAVYFVCSEALANVGKHARATTASVEVAREPERLVVTVSDDGIGGASFDAGSGLRGLADRVEALGGSLTREGPSGRGTRLRAELPLS
jgi:signal transduction histidine kinase